MGEIDCLTCHHKVIAVKIILHERLIFIKRKATAGTSGMFDVSAYAIKCKTYRQLINGAVSLGSFNYVRKILIRIKSLNVGRKVYQIIGFIEPAVAVGIKKDIRAFAVDYAHGQSIALARSSLNLHLVPVIFVIYIFVEREIHEIAGVISICKLDVIFPILLVKHLDRSSDNLIHFG